MVQQEPPVDQEDKTERRYLRKKQLRVRYGYESDRSIERAVADGHLPKPDLYMGRFPLWAEDALDAHDARAARAQATRRRDSFAASATAAAKARPVKATTPAAKKTRPQLAREREAAVEARRKAARRRVTSGQAERAS
jgi:hypothetical protein